MYPLTVQDAMILHLNKFSGRRLSEYSMPFEVTQDGIAAALGITRAHASIELKKLSEKDHVGYITAHTPKSTRKRRTYYLEPQGKSVVPEINERIMMTMIIQADEEMTLEE